MPPARATIPPWLPAKSARVSSLLACCALGPPASAALYSCRHELCTDRSAWLPLGRACPSLASSPAAAAFALTSASQRARPRSIGSRSRGSLLICCRTNVTWVVGAGDVEAGQIALSEAAAIRPTLPPSQVLGVLLGRSLMRVPAARYPMSSSMRSVPRCR